MSTINTSYAAMQYTMNATQQSNKQTKQQGSSKVAQSSQTLPDRRHCQRMHRQYLKS